MNYVQPTDVQLNVTALETMTKAIEQDIEQGVTNGAVVLVARKGQICYTEAIGKTDIEENRPANINDNFFLMSLTKSYTATVVLKAIEQGKFQLTTRIAEIFPQFAANGKEKVTIQHLLTHQCNLFNSFAPIPGLPNNDITNLEAVAHAAAALAPVNEVGKVCTYQPFITMSVLGYLLVLTDDKKRGYSQIMQDELFTPLGMQHSSIGHPSDNADTVPMVFCYGPAKNQKQSVFLNHFPVGAEIPGANAYGTIFDVFTFTEMLRTGGSYNGVRILSPAMVRYAMNNFTGDLPNSSVVSEAYRLHMDIPPGNYGLAGGYMRGEGHHLVPMGLLASPKSFAAVGGGTTMAMFDPERELTFIYLGHGHTLGLEHFIRMQKLSDLVLGAIEQ